LRRVDDRIEEKANLSSLQNKSLSDITEKSNLIHLAAKDLLLEIMKISEKYRLIKTDSETLLRKYRNFVFYFTFIAYANSHFSRKCYTCLKYQINQAGVSDSQASQMDSFFMLFYAFGSFFSGSLGDTYNPTMIVGVGLIGSGIAILMLAIGFWMNFIAINIPLAQTFFLCVWMFHGLMQSTGGPGNTVIMGNWFGPKNRGYIFGTWTCHQYIGNIAAAIVASIVLHSDISWTWALLIPCVFNIVWGVTTIFILPESPEDVGIELSECSNSPRTKKQVIDGQDSEYTPISWSEALKIPNVIGYSLAFGFFKLNNYALFFNLPFFLSQHFTPENANLISILYDVGMMPGGVIVGIIYVYIDIYMYVCMYEFIYIYIHINTYVYTYIYTCH
jgi:sugar phosphate permease